MRIERRTALLFLAILPVLVLQSYASGSNVVINEFVSSNGSVIADENGDYEDWIELYNAGEAPIHLEGYGLSDDDSEPFRWIFPAVTIDPGEFLLVWASGKNRTNPNFPLHTNFSINMDGEPLLLTQPNGIVLDYVEPIRVERDTSFGRQPDGAANWVFFAEPTPGAPNVTQGFAPPPDPPQFSHSGGFHTEAFDLVLQGAEPGVTILYTLDGSSPDADNLGGTTYTYRQGESMDGGEDMRTGSYQTHVYTDPIRIEDLTGEARLGKISSTYHRPSSFYFPREPIFKGTVVRAIAARDGALPSKPVTHTYFVSPLGGDRYELPVFSLAVQENHLFGYEEGIYTAGIDYDFWYSMRPGVSPDGWSPANYQRRGREWEYPIHVEVFQSDEGRVLAQNAGFRIHGGATRGMPQKALRLYARTSYDDRDTFDYPFFARLRNRVSGEPIASFHRLLLRNSGSDAAHHPWIWGGHSATRMRDGFLQRLIAPTGLDHQAFQPAILFLNGEFWGLLNIRERIDRYYISSNHGIDPDDVAIIEGQDFLEEGTLQDRANIIALRSFISTNDLSDPEAFDFVSRQMDVANFLQYSAAQIYIKNTDWPGNNLRYWRKRTPDLSPDAPPTHDGRWRWIVFDLDFAFARGWLDEPPEEHGATHDTLSFATQEHGPFWPNPDWSTMMLRKLLDNEQARHYFINTMADYMNTIFRPEWAVALIDEVHSEIAPHLPEHSKRWPDMGHPDPWFMREFAHARPRWVQQHVVNFFDLPGTATLTLHTPHPEQGSVRINTMTIDQDTPGLSDPAVPYPWQGVYFRGVPIELEALPAEGYRFARWVENQALGPLVSFEFDGNLTMTAHFEERGEPLQPPVVANPIGIGKMVEGYATSIDLNDVYLHPDSRPMSFAADVSEPSHAHAIVERGILTIHSLQRGSTDIVVYANDGENPPVPHAFSTLIYPRPLLLGQTSFSFDTWNPNLPEGTYPEHMLFLQSDTIDPGMDATLHAAYFIPHDDYHGDDASTIGFPYNNTRRTRINGLGPQGISFINTGRGRDLGGALLAVNTMGISEAELSWLCGTTAQNSRTYAIRLQYRIGLTGSFQDLLLDGEPLEYIAGETGETELFGPILLPEHLIGRNNLQLLWRYYHVEGDEGPRPELRLDDIILQGVPVSALHTLWRLY